MSSATPRSTVAIRFASLASSCLPRWYVVDAWSSSLIRSSTITTISSGFLRVCLTAATVGGGSRIRTWSACAPRRPSATPNSTRWPCRRLFVPAGSADECTNTSPPSSRARKPYPLSESYHLTLPVGTRRPHVDEMRTTSDQATDRMLWALLRLSVQGAGTQLRYGRVRPSWGNPFRFRAMQAVRHLQQRHHRPPSNQTSHTQHAPGALKPYQCDI